MQLKRTEWIAIAITAAFLLLVVGIKVVGGNQQVPVSVETAKQTEPLAELVAEPPAEEEPRNTMVDLNSASREELETLTGIGPTLAERIIAYRKKHGPFARPEDITLVQGIGEKTFQENAGRITAN